MTKETALAVFEALEQARNTPAGESDEVANLDRVLNKTIGVGVDTFTEPTFDVRLDAVSYVSQMSPGDQNTSQFYRGFRVRATASRADELRVRDVQLIGELVERYDLDFSIANNGIELT